MGVRIYGFIGSDEIELEGGLAEVVEQGGLENSAERLAGSLHGDFLQTKLGNRGGEIGILVV